MMLNYLKFYEMTKKEVFARAQEHFNEYDAALTEKNDLEIRIERSKRAAQDMQHNQKEYEKKSIEIKERIKILSKENEDNEKQRSAKAEELNNCEARIISLEMQESELAEKVVDVQDYEKYVEDIEMLKQELQELKAEKESGEHFETKMTVDVDAIKELLKDFNEIQQIINLSEVEQVMYVLMRSPPNRQIISVSVFQSGEGRSGPSSHSG